MDESQVSQLSLISPAGFAYISSEGRWHRAKHLDYLNRKIVEVSTGRLKYLIVSMPPRHGKSELISRYTPAWYLGNYPFDPVILISYESDFAATWGYKARLLIEDHGKRLFGVEIDKDSSARSRWDLKVAGKTTGGGMRAIGAGGPITGKGAKLLIIDDPVKNAEEANSQAFRDKLWDWYESVVKSRMEPGGGLILVMTRWHQDDLAGRVIAQLTEEKIIPDDQFEIINFPALATDHDILGRAPGEALWPWRYDEKALREIKMGMSDYWWNALYQGQPIPPGGRVFKRAWFGIIDARPARASIKLRFWDTASRADRGDWTVGTLMSKTPEGVFYIEDVVRGRWATAEVEKVILQTCKLDGHDISVRMEQEPGASGKAMIAVYGRMLAGYDFKGIASRIKKELTWEPLARQSEVGNVLLCRGGWNAAWLDEMENVPNRKGHDDQADSASGAFNEIAQIEDRYSIVFA